MEIYLVNDGQKIVNVDKVTYTHADGSEINGDFILMDEDAIDMALDLVSCKFDIVARFLDNRPPVLRIKDAWIKSPNTSNSAGGVLVRFIADSVITEQPEALSFSW